MRTVTAGFLAALRYTHRVVHHATLHPGDGSDPVELAISDGSVTWDRRQTNRGTATLTTPTRTPPITPYGDEIEFTAGIEYPDGSEEVVSLGRLVVTDADLTRPDSVVSLQLQDRSAVVQADKPAAAPVHITAGTKNEDAIEQLIQRTYPVAAVNKPGDTHTMGAPITVSQKNDPWAACVKLAKAIGCEVYPDGDEWTIQAVPAPTSGDVVWTVDVGATGVLVQQIDRYTRSGVFNAVHVVGQPLQHHAPVHYLAKDDDVTSPTLWDGPFGRVPDFIDSQWVRTTLQAQTAAEAALRDRLGQAYSIDLGSVPNPALEAGDVILLQRPDVADAVHIIDAVTHPLSASVATAMTTRSHAA